jgi:hypothetical protein
MTNNITTVQVSVLVAPAPATLQETGALISQGGTTLTAGNSALLTQLADLTPLLAGAITLSSLTSAGAVATATIATTTIASGTYNSTSGLVVLTLTASLGEGPNTWVSISASAGTGSHTAIEGNFLAAVGSAGTTLEYTVAPALTMTITGGNAQIDLGTVADTFWTTVAGSTIAGYNGTVLATVATATTFTYAVASGLTSPATGTITYTPRGINELVQMVTTFFAQGSSIGVCVLELGAGEAAAGVTALITYITANPNSAYTAGADGYFYAYLIPRSWDGVGSFVSFLANYESNTAQTYFFVTTTLSNYHYYTKTMKDVFALIEAPATTPTEFSQASAFYNLLNQNPSATNKVPPFAFTFLYGVTSYPTKGNSALLSTLKAANINVVGTGAQGGISTATLFWGTTADGNQMTYWYSIDWIQINEQLEIDNAIINGSNNKTNPLYYNQVGINRLQRVALTTAQNAVTFGMANGQVISTGLDGPAFTDAIDAGTYNGKVVVNAVPFLAYVSERPSDYGTGEYDGLTLLYITQNGFIHILFNITVTNFLIV